MASGIAEQWRSFWHTMTSNDRHASHDSPYRTGQHVPLAQNKNAPLTSGVTSAMDSRADLNSYDQDLEAGHSFSRTNSSPQLSQGQGSLSRTGTNMDSMDTGEIQMQNFSDGLPPPPPVAHSWKRINRWLEDNYEELWENLCEGATFNDVNELELELDCTLPQEVRESLQIHDGQERGGMPTGIIFGCMMLDCEEIHQEWQNWRTVNEAYFSDSNSRNYDIPQAPIKAFAGSSSSSAVPVAQVQASANPNWRQELIDKQDSQPANAIQKAYAHPAWIPMARDWGGNNIAIDLAPGPTGKWGQVILMGRDYDCKYVISRSWSAFLATVADDMNTDKWWIEEESRELKLREFKQTGVEPAYIDILRWRADQKYGRKGPKKRPGQPLRVNSQVSGGSQANGYSPYGSPTGSEDRGRSPQRFTSNGKAPATSSPRAHVSSPLARVTEEGGASPQTQKAPASIDTAMTSPPTAYTDKLIALDTPVVPTSASMDIPEPAENDQSKPSNLQNNAVADDEEEEVVKKVANTTLSDSTHAGAADDGEMKNVEI